MAAFLAMAAVLLGTGALAPGHAQPAGAPARADILAGDLIADVAEQVVPGVVNVSARRTPPGASSRQDQRRSPQDRRAPGPMPDDPVSRHFFGPGAPQWGEQRNLGSGVILSTDGLVVTNSHVVERTDMVRVTLFDGRELDATVVGSDPKSDLAVLRLQDPPRDLRPLPVGRSSDLRLGQIVLAVGNPFAVGQTVTMGIVSAKGRSRVGIVDYEDFIQTDAAINPGNSGGALVNLRGELVGINTAILSRTGGYQGIGFAIPTDMARPIIDSLIADGKVVRGFLGVGIQELDRDLAAGMGLSSTRGALISQVNPDSPAARAGLAQGDVVTAMNGAAVGSAADLRNRIAAAGPGTRVQLEVLRDGQRRTIDAVLATHEESRRASAPARVTQQRSEPVFLGSGALEGLFVQDLTPDLRRRLRLPDSGTTGVLVVHVSPNTRVARAGLRPGHLILALDRQPLSSAADFVAAQERAGDLVLLQIRAEHGTRYLTVRK